MQSANAEANKTRVTVVIYPEHGTGRAAKLSSFVNVPPQTLNVKIEKRR
jgi:hypothetical protein